MATFPHWEALKLREGFSLGWQIHHRSSRPALLKAFSDRGFYTSYYVPFPFVISEDSLVNMLGSIRQDLEQHPFVHYRDITFNTLCSENSFLYIQYSHGPMNPA